MSTAIALRALLRAPALYENERVNVIGFANLEGGAPRLYVDQADARAGFTGRGIALATRPPGLADLHHRYVLLEATLREGVLVEPTRIGLWSDPADPARRVRIAPDRQAIDEASRLSIGAIVEDPQRSHGKMVEVVGFAASTFESSALFVSEEAYRNALTNDAVWLARPADSKIHETYVRVRARLDARASGHGGMYGGTLRDPEIIERLSPASSPDFLLVPGDSMAATRSLLDRAAADPRVVISVDDRSRLYFAGTKEIARTHPGGESLAALELVFDGTFRVETAAVPGSVAHLGEYVRWMLAASCRMRAAGGEPLDPTVERALRKLLALDG